MQALSVDLRHLLVNAPRLEVHKGLEQLDRQLNFVADLSQELEGGVVTRDNYADEQGGCTLRVLRRLDDDGTRVRPYVTLTDGERQARVDLGVFIPTTPRETAGRVPTTHDVTCRDLISVLRRATGETVVLPVGTAVLAEAAAILLEQGFLPPLFDGAATDKLLAIEKRFELDETSSPTWLQVVNWLLAYVGYRGLWFDQNGRPRSSAYQAPADRAPEFTFYGQGPEATVRADVEKQEETVETPNVWRFFQRGHPAPTAGDGLYEVENQSDGPTSIDAVGRNPSVRFFDAVDQASLVTQGNRAVATDRRRTVLYRASTSPFPVAGHFDVYTFDSARFGGPRKVLSRSWRVDLGKGDTEHTWEEIA